MDRDFAPTTNPCKICAPLGVCLALKGVESAMTIMHGSQGCATYIRRYMISHFKEPLDIASSSFSESSAVFGGKTNLQAAMENVYKKYHPELIAVSATCLSETIGDDIKAYCKECDKIMEPEVLAITPPTFGGAHLNGFYAAVTSLVLDKKRSKEKVQSINIFPSIYSPADIRYLKEITGTFFDNYMVLPDYSETLDGGTWGEYKPVAPGGTPLNKISSAYLADLSVGFSPYADRELNPGLQLEENDSVKSYNLRPPIGIRGSDALFKLLSEKSGKKIPEVILKERSRVLDAFADCHKYTFEKRALVYGDADFVAGISSLLEEIGVIPVICACGTPFNNFKEYIESTLEFTEPEIIEADMDFRELDELLETIDVDIMIGNSKGYKISRSRGIPLLRCGFPIHDRVGGPQFMHIGYKGTLNLLHRVANELLTVKQESSPVGYSYQ